LKTIGLLFSLGLVVFSCSEEDKNYLNDVPKGEIVPVGERFFALTGYDEGSTSSLSMETSQVSSQKADSQTNSQKWWKYIYGEIEYNCGGESGMETVEEVGYYYAFSPDGKMYYKDGIGGTPFAYNDWDWADNSKSKVKITDEWGDSQIFEFTELNANAVVYASYQSQPGCSLLTWEQLGNPVYEDEGEDSSDNTSNIEYPYISETSLVIFAGDNIFTDDTPVYSFSHDQHVVLNPGSSCQMSIDLFNDISEGPIDGAWSLRLRDRPFDLATDPSCFNDPFEITATDLRPVNSYSSPNWGFELTPPDGSPYQIFWFEDGLGEHYKEIETSNWDGDQGSILIIPSTSFYMDRGRVKPEKVSFTFDNVRLGYHDENGMKKALRLYGDLEITMHGE